jgi:ribokinase
VKDVKSAEAAGRWLLERGAGMAMVTLGAQGAVLVSNNMARHFPAPKVKSIDSTGAGDIFSGSFMAALSAGKPLEEAVTYASAAAALSTTRLGVIESIPTVPEVAEMLQKGW